jgi:L-cysteate sulfo-lyase
MNETSWTRLEAFERVPLAHLPTPLEPLDRLSEELGGPRIWMKRDDCTGLLTGGNKTRKLEYLLADAEKMGADTVITFGAIQSNHARQTAAACAKRGIDCHLILARKVKWQHPDYDRLGNVLLDRLVGATLHVVEVDEVTNHYRDLAATLRTSGRKLYVIPTGGSNPVGALGYVNCAIEIAGQAEQLSLSFDTIIHASSSCGTQSGLVVGLASLNSTVRLLGINVSHQDGDLLLAELDELCTETAEFTGIPALAPSSICVNDDFLGEGYGIPTPETLEAIHMLARLEGILLDPVYTGKAMAGLIGLIRLGHFSKNQSVLFIHTGGSAGLFAYRDLLMNETGSI